MPRFNIALVPTDESLQALFVRHAQKNFSTCQDGYLLAKGALAHVTLCQFAAPNETLAADVFKGWTEKASENLRFLDFNFRAGVGPHAGFWWAELGIERKPDLIIKQENLCRYIKNMALEIFTPSVNYAPHLTLARVATKPENFHFFADDLPPHEVGFRPLLGFSTENGLLTWEL